MSAPAAVGQVINVGSGFEISIADLATVIGQQMRLEFEFELTADEARLRPAASEVERLLACNARARELLGWAPECPGIEGLRLGLSRTIAWFVEPANLARYRNGVYTV